MREDTGRGTGKLGGAITEDFLDVTGPMRVINLPYRHDRRREFAEQLARIGTGFDNPKVQLFDAIRPDDAAGFPTIGTRGCYLSHLGVLRQTLAEGREQVLICEDDLDFTPDMLARLPALTERLAVGDWSFFYGGYAEAPKGLRLTPGLLQADPAQGIVCAHFYAVRGPAIAALAAYLEIILTRAPGDPAGGPMHVDGAISRFRAEHPDFTTLVTVPEIGVQRSSRTDIHALRWFDRWPLVRDLSGMLRRWRRG